jgi:hypothetical protein
MNNFLQTAARTWESWMSDPDFVLMSATYLGVWLLMGVVGCALGSCRQRAFDGFILGVLLGPIGWVLILLLDHRGRKCPACLGVVPQQARRCQHCGDELPVLAAARMRRRVI